MGLLDLLVVAGYGLAVVAIGVAANRRQKTAEDYYLGGRKLRWWAVGISILATSFSSAALVGGTGAGYGRGGFRWLGLQAGDLLGFALVAVFFLPFFSGQPYTTAYEYLERRFGVRVRSLASLVFLAQTLTRVGLLVYAPASVVASLLGWPIEAAIAATAVAAIVYSSAGGLSAVVWTDLMQIVVIVVGVSVSIALVAGDVPGGLEGVHRHASDTGRLAVVDTDRPWNAPFSLPWILVAYATLAVGVQGTNQQAIQRYLSCSDLASARKAAIGGWAIGAGVMALTLALGVCLAAWRAHAPDGLPPVARDDDILGVFIGHRLPPGLAGLMVAALFAASMSSVDSAIHSMSTATMVDFVQRFRETRLAPATELRASRGLTAVFGLAALAIAILADRASTGLIETMITWLGFFAGPLLGLFVLGMISRRADESGALSGAVTAFALIAVAILLDLPSKDRWNVHPLWLAPAGTLVTVVVGRALSSPAAAGCQAT